MPNQPTVRDLVKGIQRELRGDLTPARASELLTEATALLGNCSDAVRLADLDYKRVLLNCLRTAEKANRARMEAETTPEYARFREAFDTKQLTIEMIRSLRQYLRTVQEEMRLSR